jgi:outer membrane lipoprotein SlyB
VSDAGDQGPAGIIQFNYDKTLLGATISDFGIGNTYMTSKVDKVNALPYGSVKNEEPTKINGSKVVDFIPFKFKDVVNNK